MKELDVAIQAAKAAGEILREEYKKNYTGQRKADNTLVSEADLAAEKTIIETIKQYFPDHSIFSEEAGFLSGKSDYLWIIDPLDGSTNFLHHLGNFCTAVALVKGNQPVAAAVCLPLTNELFSAETGQAATLNDKPISVSSTPEARHALLALGRSTVDIQRHARLYPLATLPLHSVRMLGSLIINTCYTACGRFDAHVCSDIKLYDALAGAMIAEAAGAKVTDFAGNPWQPNFADPTSTTDILISNPHIHSALVAALQSA